MMETPVGVSLGPIRSLPAKLEQLLSPESDQSMRLSEGEKNKIRLLKDHLQDLIDKYLMEPLEVEAPNSVRCWEKEVRELSYDIDNFLDELVHTLQAAASQKNNNLHGKFARFCEGLRRSRWVAGEASRFRARLEDAIQRHKMYNLENCQVRLIKIDSDAPPIPPLLGVKSARLVGIDSSMQKLTEWLTGDGEPGLRAVSVVGFGGIGKTTLAKELYRKLGWQFDCGAFARSSQKPDMRRLLTSILLQVCRHQPPEDSELCNLTEIIRAHLHHKKYFVIIDDLWASSTWDIVRQAFPDDKCCSRILIMTESRVVAQRCCGFNSEHIFKMDPLRDNESRKLFFSIVQSNQSENCEQFNKVSYDIIRKCGGLPLATVATAGLLATKQNQIEQCNYIRRLLSCNLQSNPTLEGMNELLLFCYNNLPEKLKACVLYLSIYEEDQIILKDDLVRQWVTEGLICAQERKDTEEVAGNYFDELVNAGMIQPVDIKYNGEVLSFDVHYMILNTIRYKSVKETIMPLGPSSHMKDPKSSSLMQKPGPDSTSSSKNTTSTGIFGTSTSGSSSLVPPTCRTEIGIVESSNLRKFTFSELKGFTRNFRADSLLGEGGFGLVYKGWMGERKPGTGTIVAVKMLKLESVQGHREWLAAVNYLGQLSHPNLVKLIGHCLEDEKRLLVYEYMPRGSLGDHLFWRGSFQPLPWYLRMKVALDAARGLAFLHSDQANIICRDFKASNILLDSEYNVKLTDFGLAKDGPCGDNRNVSTSWFMGMQGYVAPEYIGTGRLTPKCNVYSYGVVLLELLSGQPALDKSRPPGQHNLVEWARPYITNRRRVKHVLDSRLGSCSLTETRKIAALALRCLSGDPRCRPDMDVVVTVLEGLLQETKGQILKAIPEEENSI